MLIKCGDFMLSIEMKIALGGTLVTTAYLVVLGLASVLMS